MSKYLTYKKVLLFFLFFLSLTLGKSNLRFKRILKHRVNFVKGNSYQIPKNETSSKKFIVNDLKIKFYVSELGNDSNKGSLLNPFFSLEKAIDMTKALTEKKVHIYIRGGNYQIKKTILLYGLNKNEIYISSYPNEIVNISGGTLLENSKFHKITDGSLLKKLSKNAINNIYTTKLTDFGITEYGTIKPFSTYMLLPTGMELFVNHIPFSLARWPNEGLLPIGHVLQRGGFKDSIPPAFKYLNNRPTLWTLNNDRWVWGHFAEEYTHDNLPIDHFDFHNNIIFLAKRTAISGIFSSNDESRPEICGAKKIRGYYYYNILEELDTAGEWFLNRNDGSLYLWPDSEIKNLRIEVSLLEQPLIRLDSCMNIYFNNLNFGCTRGNAIEIVNCKRIKVEDCTIQNVGMLAIKTSKCSFGVIKNCKFSNLGGGGVVLDGGDRSRLINSNNIIQNCDFTSYSRIYHAYIPAVSLLGVGNTVENCFIHDSPDQAIMFQGNNHKILNNLISNVCYGVSDQGAITTGRDPSSTGTEIINNAFCNIKNKLGSTCAIYFDDGSGGFKVEKNIFYRIGCGRFGAININGGGNNNFKNNTFVECNMAFSNDVWTDERWKKCFYYDRVNLKKITNDVDIRSDLYTTNYPYLRGFFDSTNIPSRKNLITNSICYEINHFSTPNSSFIVKDTFTTTFNIFRNINNYDFTLSHVPSEVKKWQEWKPVEFNKIGIIKKTLAGR